MIVDTLDARTEIEVEEGQKILRRFTNDLDGQTTLERATIGAQQEQDAIEKEKADMRMRALYEDEDQPSVQRSFCYRARADLDKKRRAVPCGRGCQTEADGNMQAI